MAGPEPIYQRVPLLPLTHKDSSDSTLADDELIVIKLDRSGRGRTVRGVSLRVGAAIVVLLLWIISLNLSWKLSWKKAQDAAYKSIYSSVDGAAPSTSEAGAAASHADPAAGTDQPGPSPATDLFEIEGPADYSGLAEVCGRTNWVPNRWFSCDRMEGGIGNVRNEVLTCLRYTIDAGAGFVMPSLRLRGPVAFGEEDLHTGGRAGMDFYFDVDHFRNTLTEFCPGLAVADSVYDIPDFGLATFPDVLNFKDVYTLATSQPNDPDAPWPGFLNTNATSFRVDLDKAYPADLTSAVPVVHRFELAYFQWSTTIDPPLFWRNFGRLLKFTPNVIELASEVYANLVGPGPIGQAFFGIHLRIEKDVGEAWGLFEELCRDYVNLLQARPLTLVYLAGGDTAGLPRFRAYLAKQHGRKQHTVQTKTTLLSSESLSRLEAMPFDQQAQVDYLVLLMSEFHAGTAASSFTANLGARRHLLTDRRDELFVHYEDDGRTYLRSSASASFMRLAMWP